MSEAYEHLMFLYERLDEYRVRRVALLRYAVIFALCLPFAIVMTRILRFNAAMFFIYIIAVATNSAVVGLTLLSRYIRNEVRGRELEHDVRDFKLQVELGHDPDDVMPGKRKRQDEDIRYAVGDDGELIEITEPKQARSRR